MMSIDPFHVRALLLEVVARRIMRGADPELGALKPILGSDLTWAFLMFYDEQMDQMDNHDLMC